MRTLFTLLFLCASLTLSAQFPGFGGNSGPKIKGKITGKLIDSLTNEPVGYATIAVKKAGKSKTIDGLISEENGNFKVGEVKPGKYDLYISFLGYEEKVVRDVETTLKKPDNNLKKIYLVPSDYLLDEVQITDERSLIENKVDRLVFNAENDATIAGGDATDVLRKVPLLSVDQDGNVSLRGSQQVKILINGKPSGMFSTNTAEALKMFPADQIKKVEVITSPSAKYDGEGSAGIINIITKRESIEGIAGSINTSIGTRQNSAFINLNAGKGRFGFSSNGAAFYSVPNDGTSSFLRTQSEGGLSSTFEQGGTTETERLGFNGSASAFYDFNAYNAINSTFSIRGFGFDLDGTSDVSIVDAINDFIVEYSRTNVGETLVNGFDWSTDYTRKYEDDKDKEFSIAFQVSGNVQNQDFNLIDVYSIGNLDRNENNLNEGDNLETTGQLDYVLPLPGSFKLETGVKGVLRDIKSNSVFEVFDPTSQRYLTDEVRSNVFEYNQDVYAGYASLSFILAKKYSFIAGLRYEQTKIDGEFDDGNILAGNTYDNFLPNFTVSRNLKNFRNIKLSYSKRIQRPSLEFINPYNNSVDYFNRTIGNPSLLPEITQQVEMSYNTFFKGISIFTSLFYKHTDEVIEKTLRVDNEGISISSYDNVGTNNSIGLNIFSSKTINKFTVRGGGNFFTYNAKGIVNGQELEETDFQYNLFFNGDYKITGTFKVDFFGFFKAPDRTLQGTNPSFSIYGIGARKEFNNLSVGIRLIDPFNENKSFKSDLIGSNFTQKFDFTLPFRSVGINIRYKFGKVDFKERKTKIKNTDLKQGGDGNTGGAGGGAGGGMGGGGK